ncbi:Thioredoxin-like fold-containing protein [Desulfonema limicola]|uniref:Thioredoxin-like fold-containing protein n=1 Tax=Desulfonema limicola TaxID=45656 RepID=A0A975B4P9_9BACT|nr:DsbA family protein [Desulfonema limicola]QTA78739.1 Thioredoxin-like fold-containing protein [Desulfonema limicola]
MKNKSLYVKFAVLLVYLIPIMAGTAFGNEVETRISEIMKHKLQGIRTEEGVDVKVSKIPDPLKSEFDLYKVNYTKDGKPFGEITVSVISENDKSYMISGGSVWDINQGRELQFLWRSLTTKAQIPVDEQHLVMGDHKKCSLPIAVFSDYLCFHCKQFLPAVEDYVSANENMCLYFYDMPLVSLHKNSEYIAKLAIAWREITGKPVPSEIYSQEFKDNKTYIEEWFEDMLAIEKADITAFYKKASSPEIEKKIENDMQLAGKLNVRGTPSLFIDGHQTPASLDQVEIVVEYLSKK